MKNLMLVLVLLVSGIGFGQTHRNDTITKTFFDVETMNLLMIEEINEYRIENGLPALIVDIW